jgi:hypothetical protein
MKKKLFILLLSGFLSQNIYADDFEVYLTATKIDHGNTLPGETKTPIRPLRGILSNHELTFNLIFDDLIPVELIDEEDNIVYTTWLMPGETTLTLPSSFTGLFTLRLTIGAFYFLGDIVL